MKAYTVHECAFWNCLVFASVTFLGCSAYLMAWYAFDVILKEFGCYSPITCLAAFALFFTAVAILRVIHHNRVCNPLWLRRWFVARYVAGELRKRWKEQELDFPTRSNSIKADYRMHPLTGPPETNTFDNRT